MEAVKNYKTLKQEIKQDALEIRSDKETLKKTQRGELPGSASTLQCMLFYKRRDSRHRHIAYSMMRGNTYEQIERKCHKDNQPNMDLIKRIIDEYSAQAVCAGA